MIIPPQTDLHTRTNAVDGMLANVWWRGDLLMAAALSCA